MGSGENSSWTDEGGGQRRPHDGGDVRSACDDVAMMVLLFVGVAFLFSLGVAAMVVDGLILCLLNKKTN